MATNDEILMAVEIVRDYAQNPSVGVVKETITLPLPLELFSKGCLALALQ